MVPAAPQELEITGERFDPSMSGNIALEHLHRYLIARDLCRDKAVLDIACGEGYGSALLAESAESVVGVDISAAAVEHAQRKYVRPKLRFLVGSCDKIPVPTHSVDAVVSFETLEHHDRHDEMMAEAKRVLRADGVLLISTPDKFVHTDSPRYHNPFHVKELYRHELEALLSRHFRHRVFCGQRVVFGSAIIRADAQERFTVFRNEGAGYGATKGLPAPLFWIALASDGPLPEMSSGLLEASADATLDIVGLAARLAQSSANIAALRSTIELIHASTSWRMTAPLRAVGRYLRSALRTDPRD